MVGPTKAGVELYRSGEAGLPANRRNTPKRLTSESRRAHAHLLLLVQLSLWLGEGEGLPFAVVCGTVFNHLFISTLHETNLWSILRRKHIANEFKLISAWTHVPLESKLDK